VAVVEAARNDTTKGSPPRGIGTKVPGFDCRSVEFQAFAAEFHAAFAKLVISALFYMDISGYFAQFARCLHSPF
jgi:hypothetical protein